MKMTWASMQNWHRFARDTAAATTSLPRRGACPASDDSRKRAQIAASNSGVGDKAVNVGAGPMKSEDSWA